MAEKFGVGAAIALIAFIVANVAALLTHMIYTFLHVVEKGSEVVFQALATLIIGLIIPFLGALHGWMIWFGYGLF